MSMSTTSLLRSSALRSPINRSILLAAQSRRTASSYPYVPGGPVLQGTVNDPTTFPPPSKSHGSHHWAFERLLSASLIPLTAAAFVTSGSQYPVLDGLLGVALVVHSHIGFESIRIDYLHPRKWPILGPIVKWSVRFLTGGALVGIYQFNTNDVGLSEFIARIWHA